MKERNPDPSKLSIGYFFPQGQTDLIWSDEAARRTPPITRKVLIDMAQAAEAVGFDSLFLADTWSGHQRVSEQFGHMSPKHHAPLLAMGLFGVTEHIGIISTFHTTFHQPAHVARMGATLHSFSEGRWAWNVVTGYSEPEVGLFGASSMVEHDERYAMADEFTSVVKRLWEETEPVDIDGKYYRVTGRLKEPRPGTAGRPLIVNAGASPAGLNYAAKHADLLVLAGNTDQIFLDAKSELDRLGKEHGRTDKVGISPWAVSIIRDNEGEAEEEYERLASTVNEAAAIELAADILGNIDSVKKMFDKMGKDEAIRLLGAATVNIHLMGTPDQVAEKIIALKGSSEMDSLLISFPLWSPQELARFTPVLQRLQDAGIWTPPEKRNYSW